MRVSLIQRSIDYMSPERNRVLAEEWIAKCVGSRLVVLPETFTTGFCTDPESSAERGEVTLAWMQSMAAKYEVILAGSVAVEVEGHYFNRMYVVNPDGSFTKYDKHHLFSMAGEERQYSVGEERVVVEIDGVRILLLICYDLRFPVWVRNRGDYDMVLCVANWPRARRFAWDTLLRARAIENLSYLCGVNIVGVDSTEVYSGGTAAINFMGDTVASVEDGVLGVATFDLDMAALNDFRAKFSALEDADSFELE